MDTHTHTHRSESLVHSQPFLCNLNQRAVDAAFLITQRDFVRKNMCAGTNVPVQYTDALFPPATSKSVVLVCDRMRAPTSNVSANLSPLSCTRTIVANMLGNPAFERLSASKRILKPVCKTLALKSNDRPRFDAPVKLAL